MGLRGGGFKWIALLDMGLVMSLVIGKTELLQRCVFVEYGMGVVWADRRGGMGI